jgi:hypothetical protein
MRDRVKYNSRRMIKAGYDVQVCDSPEGPALHMVDILVAQKRPVAWPPAAWPAWSPRPHGVDFLQAAVAHCAEPRRVAPEHRPQ